MKKKLLGVVLVLSLIGLFGFVGTSYASVSPDITKLINLDSDNDGYSDLCEFLHKSDPYDPESKSSANITINVPSDVNSIQEAINIAIDGDTISVAQGRYQGNINFKGKSITLTSTDPQSFDVVSKTIIEGTEPGSVITIDSNSTLKGLTITSPDLDCRGMCVKSSSPTIENCTIIDNETTQSSGGIYITKTTSRPKITNCIITGNKDSTGTHESAQISGDTPQISYSWINGQGLTSSSEETKLKHLL